MIRVETLRRKKEKVLRESYETMQFSLAENLSFVHFIRIRFDYVLTLVC